ncbi:MAG: hypothetical protein ACLQGV_17135 [Bryobacteraceae bacterium]
MAIEQAKPLREPPRWPLALAVLVALAGGAAQLGAHGWRAGLRVDAGQGRRIAVEAPATLQERIEDLEERGWEGVVDAGGVRVRMRLTWPANRDR